MVLSPPKRIIPTQHPAMDGRYGAPSRHGWAIQREAEALQMVWLQEHSSLDAFAAEIQRQLDTTRTGASTSLSWRPLAGAGRPELGAVVHRSSKLEGGMGMEACFSFCPRIAADLQEGAPSTSWILKLTVQGDETPELFASFAVLYEVRGWRVQVPCQHEVKRRGHGEVEFHCWGTWDEVLTEAMACEDGVLLHSVTCHVEIFRVTIPTCKPITIGSSERNDGSQCQHIAQMETAMEFDAWKLLSDTKQEDDESFVEENSEDLQRAQDEDDEMLGAVAFASNLLDHDPIFFEEDSDLEPPKKRARPTQKVTGGDDGPRPPRLPPRPSCRPLLPPLRIAQIRAASEPRPSDIPVKRSREAFEGKIVNSLGKDATMPDLWAVQSHIKELPDTLRLFPPCVSYCYQWMLRTGRRCGLKCKYLHAKLPRGSAAKSIATESLGQFSIDDGFKKVSNFILRDLTKDLAEQRCFILDGESGATINTLKRSADFVLAPNVDAAATKALQAKCVTASSTSFTALVVASCAKVQFGCVYLDYMWPSDYFESTQLELTKYLAKNDENRNGRNGGPSDRFSACKEYADASLTDGIHDVELLVLDAGHCLLSSTGAVLAVTIVHSKKSTEAKQRARLEKVLVKGAELHKASLHFLGYTKPSGRPVATYFYAWNTKVTKGFSPNLSKKHQKLAFFKKSRKLHTAKGGA
ncbi:unnamed protein product [Cladocopium goreaui]|uniref:Uncharacterized protein n=1 Tax=Cladocopium goreaui TaxID=2562237 RepID=A0A9P1GGH2_9DINO|nr:unnamed protein product [Cladocopium goreaui]